MKHKQLAMTKLMTVWSLAMVLPMLLIPVVGVSSVLELQKQVEGYGGDGNKTLSKPDSGSVKKRLPLKRAKLNRAKKPSQTRSISESIDEDVDWSQKAMALWDNGKFKDPEKAVDYWGRAIRAKQHTEESYNNRGLAYYELEQYDKAIKDFNKAIKLDPDHVVAYNNRGNARYKRNEYRQALADFNQSLKRQPDYAKAQLNRGLVYYQMDKTGQACRDFEAACDHGDCAGTKWAVKNGICR